MKKLPSFPAKMPESQIHALIQLLSDPNEGIAKTIHDQLVAIGLPASAYLKQTQTNLDNPMMINRIAMVIADIEQSEIEKAFQVLTATKTGDVNLETGVFLIARAAYPNLDVNYYQQCLNQMAREINQQCKEEADLKETIACINLYLFKKQGFKGNVQNYYDPQNSFLNKVIDRRLGIPISLSVLYLLLCQRLHVPLVGVGMPGHFLVGSPKEEIFIDCFNQGIQVSKKDCKRFLKEYGYEFESSFLQSSPPHYILGRMLKNLIAIYKNQEEPKKEKLFLELLKIISQSGSLRNN